MSRPRGTVPVALSRHRASDLADWLTGLDICEASILGDAGVPPHEIEERDNGIRSALDELRAALMPKRTGRPRKGVACYHLPVKGLVLLNHWRATTTLPRRLRPIMWRIHLQLRLKYRELLSPELRRKNIENGQYAPETERKYRRILSRARVQKGRGLYAYKPGDDIQNRAPVLNVLPLVILPQFAQK